MAEEVVNAMTKKGRAMTRRLFLLCMCLSLSACATLVPSAHRDYQHLLVTQRWDTVYIRAQHAALGLGLQITSTQDTVHTFTAKRPTGEEVSVTIVPSGLGYLVTFKGTPAHDVTDVMRAYQQAGLF
jgi:hypothetical protein